MTRKASSLLNVLQSPVVKNRLHKPERKNLYIKNHVQEGPPSLDVINDLWLQKENTAHIIKGICASFGIRFLEKAHTNYEAL